jgi:hypothetical protein
MLFVPENKLPDSDDDVCESLAVTKQPFVFTLLPRVLVWAAFDTHTHKRWVCGPSAKTISPAEHREICGNMHNPRKDDRQSVQSC